MNSRLHIISSILSDMSFTAAKKDVNKKSSKVRRLKDPEAPKRATISFLLFAQEECPKILAEMGSIHVGELGRELGRRWGSLEKEVKDRFEQVARKDRERYKK